MNTPLQRLLRPLIERRTSQLADFLSSHLPREGKVLDFGCGDGLVGAKLRDAGRLDVTGLDVLDYRLTDLALCLYAGGPIPFCDDHFDATIAVFALHHTPDPFFYLREITRVTRHLLLILEDTFRNRVELACTRCLDRFGN
ncbi:MAG: class I SAM-dependent methyltransferase, partial [Gemmatimonadales bacterium]